MLTLAEFSKAVMQGLQKANRLAARWSGDTIQDRGVEYLATVEIARSLFNAQRNKDGGGFVDLEVSPRKILENVPLKRGRLPRNLRARGRIDIL
jgi:hypothetical protein